MELLATCVVDGLVEVMPPDTNRGPSMTSQAIRLRGRPDAP